jgi:hypothetical protein
MGRPARRHGWQAGLGNLLAVLVLFFAVPVRTDMSAARLVVSALVSLVAVGVMGFFILRVSTVDSGQLRLRPLRPVHLILALEIVLVVFALLYYTIATNTEGQITGISTRVDALYFTAVTMATVGFGDIHADGQAARALVTVQIVFNVGFVAAFAGVLRGMLRGLPPDPLDIDRPQDPGTGDGPSR